MITAIIVGVGGLVLAGLVTGVVTYIKRANSNQVALSERDAALQVEQQHSAALEAAAAASRAARAKEFADRNDQVRTADDAASLLHDEFS